MKRIRKKENGWNQNKEKKFFPNAETKRKIGVREGCKFPGAADPTCDEFRVKIFCFGIEGSPSARTRP